MPSTNISPLLRFWREKNFVWTREVTKQKLWKFHIHGDFGFVWIIWNVGIRIREIRLYKTTSEKIEQTHLWKKPAVHVTVRLSWSFLLLCGHVPIHDAAENPPHLLFLELVDGDLVEVA